MHAYFQVRRFAYLKTPRYSVTAHNDQGGSFSMGEEPSLKRVAARIFHTYLNGVIVNPAQRVVVETWHGFDENDEPVMTKEFTDVDAFLSRTGVTRGR